MFCRMDAEIVNVWFVALLLRRGIKTLRFSKDSVLSANFSNISRSSSRVRFMGSAVVTLRCYVHVSSAYTLSFRYIVFEWS